MNEINNLSKFLRMEIVANDNGIKLLISGDIIIVQKDHDLYNAKSVDECFAFILGFTHKNR